MEGLQGAKEDIARPLNNSGEMGHGDNDHKGTDVDQIVKRDQPIVAAQNVGNPTMQHLSANTRHR